MKKEDFKKINEEYFKICEILIQTKGVCFDVYCFDCPFHFSNLFIAGKDCVENGFCDDVDEIEESIKLVESCKEFLKLKE